MKYTIIEDCSPYYVRFTHDNIEEFSKFTLDLFDQTDWSHITTFEPKFGNYNLPPNIGKIVVSRTPVSQSFNLRLGRVNYFKSWPGLYYRAHKDGLNHRFSINYPIKVLDNKCITNWYKDEDLKDYPIVGHNWKNTSRECEGFDRTKHIPAKSMVAQINECILFNTDIFHAWDNTQSNNERIILTFRNDDVEGNFYYEDARRKLFEEL